MADTASERYEFLTESRRPYLDRARECAKLTIPSLMPEEGDDENTSFTTPEQSIGSRGVNTLASKLMLTLFPPTGSYFKLTVEPEVAERLEENVRAQVTAALVKSERAIASDFENNPITAPLTEALRHLINSGNILLHYEKNTADLSMYRLDAYVCRRDGVGRAMEIITVDSMAPSTLSEEAQAIVLANDENALKKDEDVEVYTWATRVGKMWRVHQEVDGVVIEGSRSKYPLDRFPYMALRWNYVDAKDYGRGLIEEYFGDLKALDDLSGAVREGTMGVAKLIWLINPNGITDEEEFANTENMDVIAGRKEDIETAQAEKFADFTIAERRIGALTEQLAYAFLLNSAIQRKGERVTAEEIRIMASELQDALGGVYTLLADELQLPLVRLQMARAQSKGLLPQLPAATVKPSIVTGIAALGRGHELQKIDAFVAGIRQLFGDEVAQRYLKVSNILNRKANATGLPADEVVKTEQEVTAEEQQQMQAQMVMQQQTMAAQAGADVAADAMTQQE